MALRALKDNFAGKAAAAGLSGLLAVTPLTGAVAQEQQSQQAEFTEASAQISAPTEAARWSLQNIGGVGVAISMGQNSRVTPQQVEQVIRRDFATNGVSSVRFFYDNRLNGPSTVMSFHVDGGSTPDFTIRDVRAAIPAAAEDAKHMARYPELASN